MYCSRACSEKAFAYFAAGPTSSSFVALYVRPSLLFCRLIDSQPLPTRCSRRPALCLFYSSSQYQPGIPAPRGEVHGLPAVPPAGMVMVPRVMGAGCCKSHQNSLCDGSPLVFDWHYKFSRHVCTAPSSDRLCIPQEQSGANLMNRKTYVEQHG